jgi:glycine cleavage system protein P-like pyridoxal-binding family
MTESGSKTELDRFCNATIAIRIDKLKLPALRGSRFSFA